MIKHTLHVLALTRLGVVGSNAGGSQTYTYLRTTALAATRRSPRTIFCVCAMLCCSAQAKEHVEANVGLAAAPQLTPRLWGIVHSQMLDALAQQQQAQPLQ